MVTCKGQGIYGRQKQRNVDISSPLTIPHTLLFVFCTSTWLHSLGIVCTAERERVGRSGNETMQCVTPPDMGSKVKGFNGHQKKGMWNFVEISLPITGRDIPTQCLAPPRYCYRVHLSVHSVLLCHCTCMYANHAVLY